MAAKNSKAAFLKALGPSPRMDADIDCDEAAEAWGISRRAAYERLNRLVQQGRMTSHLVHDGKRQRRMRVWREVAKHLQRQL
jgi:predicted ArsR family transcriptional regulator